MLSLFGEIIINSFILNLTLDNIFIHLVLCRIPKLVVIIFVEFEI